MYTPAQIQLKTVKMVGIEPESAPYTPRPAELGLAVDRRVRKLAGAGGAQLRVEDQVGVVAAVGRLISGACAVTWSVTVMTHRSNTAELPP